MSELVRARLPPNVPNFLTRPLRSSKYLRYGTVAAVVWSVEFHRNQNTVVRGIPNRIVQALD